MNVENHNVEDKESDKINNVKNINLIRIVAETKRIYPFVLCNYKYCK